MRKFTVLLALAALALVPTVAQADTVLVGDIVKVELGGGTRFGSGGAFMLTDLTNPAVPASFVTFCLESNEYLGLGAPLLVTGVTTGAVRGGFTGGNPDPLDVRSAFIYTNYRFGNPYGWSGSDVQQALWWIEGETNVAANPPAWVTDGTLAGYMTAAGWTSGLRGVRVLNTNYINTQYAPYGQDLLTIVPDGGATLMLLGGALMGLGALRRKFRG